MIHLAIDHLDRIFQLVLPGQRHDLLLALQVLLLLNLEAVEQYLVFGQHNQRFIQQLRGVQLLFDFEDFCSFCATA
jgi:hypothetical protein